MRAQLTIMRKAAPPSALLPWQDKAAPQLPQNPDLVFDVEIRDAAMLNRQEGWYNLGSPEDNSGVLMVLDKPGIMPINTSPQYAPLDILMINQEGAIIQIAPNIQLSALESSIVPQSEVLAFMFIKGGNCEKLSISPGDVVEYKLFKKSPVILSNPSPPKPAAAEAAPKAAPAEATPAAPLMMETK